jgi:hypothetical protein
MFSRKPRILFLSRSMACPGQHDAAINGGLELHKHDFPTFRQYEILSFEDEILDCKHVFREMDVSVFAAST